MGAKRGRKPANELSIANLLVAERAEPVPELGRREAEHWRRIVGSMPAEWFPPETHGVLRQLCIHLTTAENIMAMTENLGSSEPFCPNEYLRLAGEQRAQSATIKALATSLRLTPQSAYCRKTAATAKGRRDDGGEKPWEFEG